MSWEKLETKGDIPEARHSASLVFDPTTEEAILFGGASGRKAFGDIHILDTKTWTWRLCEPAASSPVKPGARWGHCALMVPGTRTMIVFGGSDLDKGLLCDVLFLNLETMEWTRPAAITGATPPPREYASAAMLDKDTMYVFGGECRPGGPKDGSLYAFDLRTNAWNALYRTESVQGMPEARKRCTMTHVKDDEGHDKMVIIGGVSLKSLRYLSDVVVYDVTDDVWMTTPERGAGLGPRAGHIAELAGGKIVVFGGMSAKSTFPEEVHQLSIDQWSWFKRRGTGKIPTARHLHSAAPFPDGKRMLVFGGISGADEKTALNDVYVYSGSASRFF